MCYNIVQTVQNLTIHLSSLGYDLESYFVIPSPPIPMIFVSPGAPGVLVLCLLPAVNRILLTNMKELMLFTGIILLIFDYPRLLR